jgi:hypothetical protein
VCCADGFRGHFTFEVVYSASYEDMFGTEHDYVLVFYIELFIFLFMKCVKVFLLNFPSYLDEFASEFGATSAARTFL